jgi:hypothetical protein
MINSFRLIKKPIEVTAYYLLLLYFSLQPFFSNYFTFDGPAHLYNANLINQIISDNLISDFVNINSILVPNWSGHFLLSVFQLFLDPLLSERLLLCLIIFFTNFLFRRLIIILSGNVWASWLLFPFVTSFLFFMGFYNLSVAIFLLFLFLERYIKLFLTEKKTFKNYLLIGVLFLCIYFSHLFIFLFSGLLALFITLYFSSKKEVLKNLTALLLSSIIPLVLSVLFLLSQQRGVYEFIPKMKLLYDLLEGRIVTVFGDNEIEISSNIAVVILIITAFPITYYSRLQLKSVYYLVASLIICFIMYLMLPNSNGHVGYISLRFVLLIFINLIVFIALSYNRIKVLKPILITCSIIIALIAIKRTKNLSESFQQMQPNFNEVIFVSKNIIPNNSIVKIKSKSNHWFYSHLDNYLGVYSENVFLINSNYELENNYFPLVKKENIDKDYNGFNIIEVAFNPIEKMENTLYQSSFIVVTEVKQ